MDTIRLGVAGCGRIFSDAHLPAISKFSRAEITALSDPSKDRLEKFGAALGVTRLFENYHDMVGLDDIDAVIVCAPNREHAPASIAALNSGKHVLCEKPIAVCFSEAKAIFAASKKSGKIFMPGLNNRFLSESLFIKEQAEKGDLGEIYFAKAGFIRRRGCPSGWFTDKSFSGGGPVIDLGVHVLDLAFWFMGYPEKGRVSAEVFNKIGEYTTDDTGTYKASFECTAKHDVEDAAVVLIRLPGEKAVTLEVSWALNCKQNESFVKVYGDKAGASLWPPEIYSEIDGRIADIAVKTVPGESFVREYEDFFRAIDTGAEPMIKMKEALVLTRFIEAVYESGKKGCEIEIKESDFIEE